MNKKYKILIVEDQPITAMDIKQTIINLGYEVVGIAKSYESAMNKLTLGNANLIKRAEEFIELGVKPKKQISSKLLIQEEE